MFLFYLTVNVFGIAQKLENSNLQCCCGNRDNSKYEIVSEGLSITLSKCSVFSFIIIIIIPTKKFGLSLSKKGNFTINKFICLIADTFCFNNTYS